MRPYYFDFDQIRTRRAVAIVAFERAMRGGWPSPRRGGPAELFHAALALIRQWRERARQRRQLARLDVRMLRDIGLTAAEAERECEKPFWRR
ncbi:MAG TPA: DUF1127 domain-containing protein [Stellaceae bacterium]|nr:DUF1127 domain-containing protein [Stellaceae bacterium]